MVGRAKSLQKRRVQFSDEREQLIQEVLTRYKTRPMRTIGGRTRPKGLRVLCAEVSDEHAAATGRRIHLSHSTLAHRAKGRKSRKAAREAQAHLTKPEAEMVCAFVIDTARKGYPFSHKRLEEHINKLIRQRIPSFSGVGACYTSRFVDTHHDKLSMHSSRSLDGVRASAVNPTTVEAWFEMLAEVIEEFSIEDDQTYGADETGVQPVSGNSERVIGPQGSKIVYQIRTGSRETITVIATICADGTSLPPTVIFKGKHYLLRWDQDNPLNALIAHSAKGWVNGEIALGWLRDFDEKTRAKAAGRYRLLIVDGHTSHVGFELLEYARDNKIVMPCYPSHATHVLQGLDKVCFGPFKEHWSKERDKHERETGRPVEKSTFLGVMSKAYTRAFTKQNIQAAFRVTGVVPLNPSVIQKEDMAPAAERSCKTVLPLPQPAPVQAIVDFLQDGDSDSDLHQQLSTTSASFLISDSPVVAKGAELPDLSYKPLDPIDDNVLALANVSVASPLERNLQNALRTLIERDRARDNTERAVTAQMALQSLYCTRLRGQLAGKQDSQKQKHGRLLGDGMPVVLTSDELHRRAVEQQEQKQREHEHREAVAEAKRQHKEATERWKEKDNERIKRNQERAERWKDDVNAWNTEKEFAKLEKRKPRWLKPSKPKVEKGSPKPVLTLPRKPSDVGDDGSNSSDEDEDEE
ncbi:hypothetical protein FS749_006099 [Ceratobasidium sp. UAMH 11750]|nr:hypothetical protein FS749_006099 [Ceratobasidium sp. UAMH 11750]